MNRFSKNCHLLTVLILIINQFISVSNTYAARNPIKRGFLQADFTTLDDYRLGCCPFQVQFQDSSSGTAGKIIEWKWYFGDGDSSLLQNPFHLYRTPGLYDVTLKITNDSGYIDQITKTGYIKCTVVPGADFVPRPSITYLSKPTIYFENRTSHETPLTEYTWNFDDHTISGGGTSKVKNPSWTFSDTGHYHIMLISTNEYGCLDSSFRVIVIMEDPTVYFPTYYFHKGFRSNGFYGNTYYEYFPIDVWGVAEMHIEVFNLSGALVFKSDDPKSTKWEGSYLPNNSPAASEMYIIRIKYRGFDNIWYTKTKKIVLQR